ncbi:hydroxymethylglutaryl-CoA reductase, degradative [Aureitalea sp. L0-47]|uniref:hydroxymethylglutaryl-CoA reductase, degradative n=1 Tax=Aureitalea sp. L0-47 TaxID=2816962 RepID=UPI0022387981|nr:hydroxymethylglutaryl-CoA reductase, degradative [Aureitalea sp. L0-47]MCW5518696.1 hydroxymethylglutaryl-CoA reductase, degradative [Aureitalea sp. L0-47]
MDVPVSGFSKKSKQEKIEWLANAYFGDDPEAINTLRKYWNSDTRLQELHDDFTENVISNYYLPFSVAPNFLINDTLYTIPMVIEESSVVAAASNAAKFWLERGGFNAEVISTVKTGQIHIDYFGNGEVLNAFFSEVKNELIDSIADIQKNMKARGGGLIDIELKDATSQLNGYYELHCTFETLDAMGANFINSCLEKIAATFETAALKYDGFNTTLPKIVLSILSNYVPECVVRAWVGCPLESLSYGNTQGKEFAENFVRAIDIAKAEVRRAVTHNKGIMNGIDAVVLATGNDFRAVEAGVHAYAAKSGRYTSLTEAVIENNSFTFSIEVPLALGTVGGLTSLHPLVKFALQLLRKPSAKELMKIVAVAGLAQNFAAIRSLVTTGIQQGHMKMHLMNILNQLQATSEEKEKAIEYFTNNTVSHSAAVEFIEKLRA